MDLLARRAHSELELRQKLSRSHVKDEVSDAIEFARANGWLTAPEELAERVSAELGRKRKGHLFIRQFLKAKGLPPVHKDLEEEIRKGHALLAAKLVDHRETIQSDPSDASDLFDHNHNHERQQRRKIQRLLANRGFDDETIQEIIRERSLNNISGQGKINK